MQEIEHSGGSANIIGIDLGAHSARLARLSQAGELEITSNIDGEISTPSAVHIESDGVVTCGREAKKLVGLGTSNVFTEFMLEMGRDQSWKVNGRSITPEDLIGYLLKQMTADYTHQFGRPDAVAITWPANIRDKQRSAYIKAASKAGVSDAVFVEEATAAALYYGTHTYLDGKYLVCKFGRDSFEATLLECKGLEVKVIHSDGIAYLGSAAIDAAVLSVISRKFEDRTGGTFNRQDCGFYSSEIESTKHTLSTRESTDIRIISETYGVTKLTITRREFETAISPLIVLVEKSCQALLEACDIREDSACDVFMIGGNSRIPCLQKSLAKSFGRTPIIKEPELAAAKGAAIYAAKRSAEEALTPLQRNALLRAKSRTIAPCYLGIIYTNWLTGATSNVTIIRRGETLPVRRTFKIKSDKRGNLPSLKITQSAVEETNPEFVTTIWEDEFEGCSSNAEIELSFDFGENGELSVSLLDISGGKTVKAKLDIGFHEL